MNARYRLTYRGVRGGMFYYFDKKAGKRFSLGTRDEAEAKQLIEAKNIAERQPTLNMQIAKAYIAGSDTGVKTRTWREAMEALTNTKHGANKERWQRVTVCIDLPTAVGASLILASALLVRQLSELTHIHPEEEVREGGNNRQTIEGRQIPDGVMAFRVFGAFFFGAADKLETSLRRAGQLPDVLILRMRDVLALDATGLDALEDLLEKLRIKKKDLILCAPRSQPLFALTRSGFIDKIGEDNICGNIDVALDRARKIIAERR